jgi:hypothetical protein
VITTLTTAALGSFLAIAGGRSQPAGGGSTPRAVER